MTAHSDPCGRCDRYRGRSPRQLHPLPPHEQRDPAATVQNRRVAQAARTPFLECRAARSEEHTSELQSLRHLVCRLLLEKKKKKKTSVLLHTPPFFRAVSISRRFFS